MESIASQPTPDAVATLCETKVPPPALQNALTAAALHFAVSHMVLLLAGAFAFAFALRSIRNVVAIHGGPFVEKVGAFWIALAGTLALGLAVYDAAIPMFAPLSNALFGVLESTAQLTASSTASSCLGSARSLSTAFDAAATWGVRLVASSSSALAAAAATIAWRFEIHEIDGVWADTYVLRHKLKALLTLFVLGSLLLVASNIALSAYTDLGADVIKALQPPESDAAVAGKTATEQTGGAAKATDAVKTTIAKPDEDLANLGSLRKVLLNVVGALSSLTLVGMFLPAFVGLTSEIEMAGKTHADADMRADPPPAPEEIVVVVDSVTGAAAAVARQPPRPPENVVAGYKAVVDWKANHGLALDFGDVATAMAAAAAPLLSNGVFDVAKSVFNVP